MVYWNGKKQAKVLKTSDIRIANRIKHDAEVQIQRIQAGDAAEAVKLLSEGFSILDLLFGSPELDQRRAEEPSANDLTIRTLADTYFEFQLPSVGPDERYNSTARFKKLCEFFGDDRLVIQITDSALQTYHAHRMGDGLNGTSVQKESGSLKAAISWAVKTEKIPQSPIKVWPHVKVTYTIAMIGPSCTLCPKPCIATSEAAGFATARHGNSDAELGPDVNVTDVVNTIDATKQLQDGVWEYQVHIGYQFPVPHQISTRVTDIVLHVDATKLVPYALPVVSCP